MIYGMYHIYGYDLKTGETCLLQSLHGEREAIDWAKKYTFRDMGGWDKICVLYTAQIDVDWDGEPVTSETVVWSIYNEPMDYWSDNAHEEF